MGLILCTPLACLHGVLLVNEQVVFQVAHEQARDARAVRMPLGVARISCAALRQLYTLREMEKTNIPFVVTH